MFSFILSITVVMITMQLIFAEQICRFSLSFSFIVMIFILAVCESGT